MLRSFKPAYWVYNFFKKGELAHNIPLYKKHGIKKSYYASISSKDFEHKDLKYNPVDLQDARSYLPKQKGFNDLPLRYQDAMMKWSDQGYAILEEYLSEKQVEEVNAAIDNMIQNKDVSFRYGGKKIMFAFQQSEVIRSIGLGEPLLSILRMLMGKEVDLFQSINFIKGSEQRTHSDAIHMSTYPLGNLIAVWIALEDITIDNGPLHYYPGSHKLPYLSNKDIDNEGNGLFLGDKDYSHYEDKIDDILEGQNFKKELFLAKKGDLLIWHGNLLHGGNAMNDPQLTRKSQVFHYYGKDAICYHELTQRPSLKSELGMK